MLGCRHIQKLKTPRLKDFTAFFFIFRLLISKSKTHILSFSKKRKEKSKVFFTFFHPEETKSILKHKYNTAGRTIREMLYRFPISIYMIFSRLRHPQTLAALVHLRSFGGEKKTQQPCLSTGTFWEPHKQWKKKNRKKESKIPRLLCLDWIHTHIYPPHKLDEYLEAISFFSWTYIVEIKKKL